MRTVVDVKVAGHTSMAVQAGPEAVASPSALRLAGPASRIKDKLIPRTRCAPGSPYPLARSRVKAPPRRAGGVQPDGPPLVRSSGRARWHP